MEDFWDRHIYTGQAGELNSDAILGGTKLGLAEFSNGNFLGEDALYAEYFKPGHKHYFPFPSLWTSTTFPAFKNSVSAQAKVSFLKDGSSVNRFFIKKHTDGIVVERHSALLYLGVQGGRGSPPGGWMKVASTIKDNTVLEEYHQKLIPKAVEYSAGILDYFFRGQLEVVSVVWDGTQYSITVRNQSGQELVNGGKFHVLKDDASENRTPVTAPEGVSLTQNVADGNTWQFNYPGPQVGVPTKFIVVYRGTIGLTGGLPSDSVDAGIAIAAKRFVVGCQGNSTDLASLPWDVDPDQGNNSHGGTFNYPNGTFYFNQNLGSDDIDFEQNAYFCNPNSSIQANVHVTGRVVCSVGCSGKLILTIYGASGGAAPDSDEVEFPFNQSPGPVNIPFTLDASLSLPGPAGENYFIFALTLLKDSGIPGVADGTITVNTQP